MQHVIWEMYKIPFLVLALLLGIAFYLGLLAALWALVRWIRSNPYKPETPAEAKQSKAKKDFFDET